MPGQHWMWIAVVGAIATVVRPANADITDGQVQNALRSGTKFLSSRQRVDGSWSGHPGYPGGVTALCTLALLNGGVEASDPVIQKALRHLRSLGAPQMVYSTALQTMVFAAAEPEKDRLLISRNVQWLEATQIKSGGKRGAWKYSDRRGSGDNSNTQFALLALHEAERAGVPVQPGTWELALDYWLRTQNDDGSWSYIPGDAPTGSMTCAGIASVLISQGHSGLRDASVVEGTVRCCGAQDDHSAIERGLRWLASKFSVDRNPNPIDDRAWLFYYLYGVERVGRMSGRRFIGRTDWYREGAEFLVAQQDPLTGYWKGEFLAEENEVVSSCFALLFLAKGRRPVLMSKLKYGSNTSWDPHRNAVAHLTRRVEQSWKQDLTWQTIDLRAATPADLLESPVLFISGSAALALTPEQKESLRQYVNSGGFLFAEASCGSVEFDRSFRQLTKELFPDTTLRVLPSDHPVWFAENKVDSRYLRPLYGIDACCRTSVVYCPQDLACYWELDRLERESPYPATVQAEIEACTQIGKNVITYATNRELKDKLDRPFVAAASQSGQPRRGTLYVPKLLHNGGGDDAPNALPNLLQFVAKEAQLRVGIENRVLTGEEESLFEYPVIFMHGRRDFRFTAAQKDALQAFVQRGGFVFADAICGSPQFQSAFRREMVALFPSATFQRLPRQHPLFSREFGGYDLASVQIRDPAARRGDDPLRAELKTVAPVFEALTVDDRVAVLLSPYDLSCALENSTSVECRSYVRDDAARLGVNVLLFALQQ